jgi:hypothetical protein
LSITLSSVLIFNAIKIADVKSGPELGLPANVTIAALLLVKSGFYGYVWLKLLELYKELGQKTVNMPETAVPELPDQQAPTSKPQTLFSCKSQIQFPRLPSRCQLHMPHTSVAGEHPPNYLKASFDLEISTPGSKITKN